MILELDNQHIAEVFEILCGIQFEPATMHDTEPATTRHEGIDRLIEQLRAVMDAQADADAEVAKDESDAMVQSQAEDQARAEAEAMSAAEADEYHEDYEGR